jgi:acetate---CoA ligase (ADP-forming)
MRRKRAVVGKFSEETKEKLRAGLYAETYVENPIDVAATATADHFALALTCLDEDPGVDSILLTMVTPFFVDCEAIARRIAETVPKLKKPIIAVVMTNENWAGTVQVIKDAGIPVFDYPEAASRVLAAMARYDEMRKRVSEAPAQIKGNKARAKEILAGCPGGFISQAAAFELLAAYDIPTARTLPVLSAAAIPAQISYPAVLKVDSADVVHKSDTGGVVMNIANEAALKSAIAELAKKFPGAKFVVQEQCVPGTEVIIGMKREEGVGPVLMFGLGGIYVEALNDATFRLAPLSSQDAGRMIKGIRAFKLLAGTRGRTPADISAIERLLISISQMSIDLPEILEMDLNPVFVYEKGAKVVDVRIKK